MKKTAHILASALAAVLLAASPSIGAQGEPVKLKSLRGDTPIDKTNVPDMFKQEKDRPPIPRDFVQQPPLIPHTTKGYEITKNFNKCMDCHSWSRYKETGATKVSLTHFKDREGREGSNISPLRYFCTQCHVPQTDAAPLVANEFQPAKGLR
jgi:cytochrome c-type protein NapB